MDALDALAIAAILLAVLVLLIVLAIACAIGLAVAAGLTLYLAVMAPIAGVCRAVQGRRS